LPTVGTRNMKNLFLRILLISSPLFARAQTEVAIYLFDSCSKSILATEFSVTDERSGDAYFSKDSKITLLPGKYLISFFTERYGRYILSSKYVEIENQKQITDTLRRSKIELTSDGAEHTDDYSYYNCSERCDGYEEEFDDHGIKVLDGNFQDGKPIKMRYFSSTGVLSREIVFEDSFTEKRVNYFDVSGNLKEYCINIYRNRRVLKKWYDSTGRLIRKEWTK